MRSHRGETLVELENPSYHQLRCQRARARPEMPLQARDEAQRRWGVGGARDAPGRRTTGVEPPGAGGPRVAEARGGRRTEPPGTCGRRVAGARGVKERSRRWRGPRPRAPRTAARRAPRDAARWARWSRGGREVGRAGGVAGEGGKGRIGVRQDNHECLGCVDLKKN